ncbi:MAG: DNA ligase [Desulfitobacterium hafniense]|nr:DNA ligase [Desulfitobacterium hafniense]
MFNLKPIVPFEPILTEDIPEGEHWIAQVKWDGVRVLTYYDGNEVHLFNRKLNERTSHYPELAEIKNYCSASSVILDGEIIALDNGKPSFFEVMRRDGIRNLANVDQAQNLTAITYMLFDVLYYDGEWINNVSLKERQAILNDIIVPTKQVHLVDNFIDAKSLFDAIKAQGMEGVVCKDLRSAYQINGKDGRWQKIKNYRDLIAVIGGYTLRANIVNSVLLGLYDKAGKFWYIGHTGTGKMTHQDWIMLTDRLELLQIKERPFINKPERATEAYWVSPQITAKVKFSEWTPAGSLRQPSIQGFVTIPPEECKYS